METFLGSMAVILVCLPFVIAVKYHELFEACIKAGWIIVCVILVFSIGVDYGYEMAAKDGATESAKFWNDTFGIAFLYGIIWGSAAILQIKVAKLAKRKAKSKQIKT